MKIVFFCQSILSDWNNESAHFNRGVVSELQSRGYDVTVFEPRNSLSFASLSKAGGEEATDAFFTAYPDVHVVQYDPARPNLDNLLKGVSVVMVHESADANLITEIGRHHQRKNSYRLFFLDGSLRHFSSRETDSHLELAGYDGVLAGGRIIRESYVRRGWKDKAWVWHEAADTKLFHPARRAISGDLVWIGDWNDGDRWNELQEFLIEPVKELGLKTRLYGAGYPDEAIAKLTDSGISYGGYIPTFRIPVVYSRHRMTVHIPSRNVLRRLPGIPSIGMFEALAFGIPLISAPWADIEGLFGSGDYVRARNGEEMATQMEWVLTNEADAHQVAENGRHTVMASHTTGHRVDELLQILESLEDPLPARVSVAS